MSLYSTDGSAKTRAVSFFIGFLLVAILPSTAITMDVKPAGDQLILTGPVVSGDLDRVQNILAQSPGITTVILRYSPGGHAPTGYKVGELFREKGLRTAVSGYCYSSCSRMFLGGKVRVLTDDAPPDATEVGFHGHYDATGQLQPSVVEQLGLKQWIIRYSDGKADPALVERWINIPIGVGMIHFFHPGLARMNGVSTFMCQGPNPPGKTVFDCEPITRTALDLGIITSLDIISSNDLVAARAAMPQSLESSAMRQSTIWRRFRWPPRKASRRTRSSSALASRAPSPYPGIAATSRGMLASLMRR